MENLENKIKTFFLGKIKDSLGKIRSFTIGKFAAYSLAGVLGAGLGYGCEQSKGSDNKDSNESSTISDCNNACIEIIGENKKYSCVANQCVEDSNGIYAVSNCYNTCAKETGEICWEKTFNHSINADDEGYYTGNSVQQIANGNFIIAGSADDDNGKYLWLLELDEYGNVELDKTLPCTNYTCYSPVIRKTSDKGYIVGENDPEYSLSGTSIIKLDQAFNVEWQKNMKEYGFYDINSTTDEEYIIAGSTESNGTIGTVIKLDKKGNIKWLFGNECNTISGECPEFFGIQQTSDPLYYIVSGSEGACGWLAKFKENDSVTWEKFKGDSPYNDSYNYDCALTAGEVWDVKETVDKGYVTAGVSHGPYYSDPQCVVEKFNSEGNSEWVSYPTDYATPQFTSCASIQQTSDKGYIMVGMGQASGYVHMNNINLVTIAKMNKNGDNEWLEYFGDRDKDDGQIDNVEGLSSLANEIQQVTGGGYIAVGSKVKAGYDKGTDLLVVKLDKDGNSECK
jgi:hypothetical protein